MQPADVQNLPFVGQPDSSLRLLTERARLLERSIAPVSQSAAPAEASFSAASSAPSSPAFTAAVDALRAAVQATFTRTKAVESKDAADKSSRTDEDTLVVELKQVTDVLIFMDLPNVNSVCSSF